MGAEIVKKFKYASAIMGVGCLIYLFGIWLPMQYSHTKRHLGTDAYIYYVAAALVLTHHSPYAAKTPPYLTVVTNTNPHIWLSRDPYGPDKTPICYLYSPQFAVAFTPLILLSPPWFGRLWATALAITLVVYSFVLASLIIPGAERRDRLYAGLSIFPILLFSPNVLFNIGMGNVDLLLSTLIGAAFISNRRNEILAVVGQIKPFALLPLALDCIRDRRQFPRAIVIIGAGCIIGVAACGLESFVIWRKVSTDVLGQGTFLNLNWSLSFALLRLLRWLGVWHYTGGPLAVGPRAYLALTGSMGILAIVFATRRMPHIERCAACLLGAVLLAPICWPNYLVVGYIYAALRLRRFLDDRRALRSVDINEMAPVSAGV